MPHVCVWSNASHRINTTNMIMIHPRYNKLAHVTQWQDERKWAHTFTRLRPETASGMSGGKPRGQSGAKSRGGGGKKIGGSRILVVFFFQVTSKKHASAKLSQWVTVFSISSASHWGLRLSKKIPPKNNLSAKPWNLREVECSYVPKFFFKALKAFESFGLKMWVRMGVLMCGELGRYQQKIRKNITQSLQTMIQWSRHNSKIRSDPIRWSWSRSTELWIVSFAL